MDIVDPPLKAGILFRLFVIFFVFNFKKLTNSLFDYDCFHNNCRRTIILLKCFCHLFVCQGKIADMYTSLSASRNYLYNVSRASDRGHVSSKDCAGVLLFAAENSITVALDAIQCLGGLRFFLLHLLFSFFLGFYRPLLCEHHCSTQPPPVLSIIRNSFQVIDPPK